MTRAMSRKSVRLSTSFTPAEVELLLTLVRNALSAGASRRELVAMLHKLDNMAHRAAVVREMQRGTEAKAS